MIEEPSQGDVVCLYLDALDAADAGADRERGASPSGAGGSRTPPPRTLQGIGAALELERETTARLIGLLSTLEELESAGLVTSESTADGATTRTRYRLTDAGREHARGLRERIGGRTVTVTNGFTEELAVGDLDRYFTEFPLVRALTRLTDDGRIHIREVGGAFVNRETELDRLRAALRSVSREGSRTILISGEAGVGKTALVEQLLGTAREEGFGVATGRCRRFGDRPYGPVLSAFRDLPDSGPLVEPLETAAGDVDDPEALEAGRTALFNEVADAVRDRAEATPLVVFLDDLHWAGPDTRRLFAHLARTVTEWVYPVLFLATYRSEAAAADEEFDAVLRGIAEAERTEHLSVGPLRAADGHGLVAWLADRPDLPEEFLAAVRERTGGNPLLIRETVQRLLDVGVLDDDGVPTDPADVPVPDDVARVVETRLSILPDDTRRVLEAAAVAGETAAPELLAAVLDEPEATVNDHLDVLVTGRFLDRTGDEVGFVGGVVRDAILDGLSGERRRQLHAETAGAVLSVSPGAARDHAARVAHHFERADRPRRALDHYRRAGDRARGVYAHEDALEAYRAALSLARDLADEDERRAVLSALGDTCLTLGRYERAREHFDEARDLARDTAERQRLHERRAETYNHQGEFEAAIEAVEAGLSLSGAAEPGDAGSDPTPGGGDAGSDPTPGGGDDEPRDPGEEEPRDPGEDDRVATPEVAGLLCVKAKALEESGDLASASEVASRACERARAADAPGLEARALFRRGNAAVRRGAYAEAARHLQASLGLARDLGDDRRVADSLNSLGGVAFHRGDLDAAADYFEESLAIHRETGERRDEAQALNNLGAVARNRNDPDAAREYYERSLAIKREIGNRRGVANTLNNLGLVTRDRGDLDAAAGHFEESMAIHREIGDRNGEAKSWNNLGGVLRLRGDLDGAADAFAECLAIHRAVGDSKGEASARHNLGEVARLQGDLDAAAGHFEEAAAISRDLGDAVGETEARTDLGTVAVRRGDLGAAADHLDRALSLARERSDPGLEGGVLVARGELATERGEFDAAGADLREGLSLLQEASGREVEVRGLLARGRLARRRGDPAGAEDRFEEALELAREGGHRLQALDALAELARVRDRVGDPSAAREACERALDLVDGPETDALAEREATFRERLPGLDDDPGGDPPASEPEGDPPAEGSGE